MLAGHLGMTVREAQSRISSLEFSEWVAYFRVQPFGDRQLTMNNASQCYWSYVAFNGNEKVKLEDFDMETESGYKAQTMDEKMALLKTISPNKE